mmetsp:Transcript_27599/g.69176  ORF Transcript_27599/g.69176 Transcript_27599/m.69176 type:complete len:200 (+) Transcript_27599:460-1059(+)
MSTFSLMSAPRYRSITSGGWMPCVAQLCTMSATRLRSAAVSGLYVRVVALPKSHRRTTPVWSMRMFSTFKSRCAMGGEQLCSTATATHVSLNMSQMCSSGKKLSRPRWLMTSTNMPPWQYGISSTTSASPCGVVPTPAPSNHTMFLWRGSCRMMRISSFTCSKSDAGQMMRFSAYSLPWGSATRYTLEYPPCAISRRHR